MEEEVVMGMAMEEEVTVVIMVEVMVMEDMGDIMVDTEFD